MFTNAYIRTYNATTGNKVAQYLRSEEGEAASWIILAALMAGAAAFAGGQIDELIRGKGEEINGY